MKTPQLLLRFETGGNSRRGGTYLLRFRGQRNRRLREGRRAEREGPLKQVFTVSRFNRR